MGKKSRKKKNADFKKVKLKVGRKLPRGKDVDLTFSTKKICIREDAPLIEESGAQKVLSLSKITPKLRSRHSEELTVALNDLRLWMKQKPDDARQLLLMEIEIGLVPLLRHLESKVRDAARQVFTSLLHICGSTPAYFPIIAHCMFSALVHIDIGVRESGWQCLRLMVDVTPKLLPALNCDRLLEELSRRIPQESVNLNSIKTGRIIRLVERLLTTLSPASSMDLHQTTPGPEKVDGVTFPFRNCLFDCDPASMDLLWLNGHLPRAQEQGLGWQGQPKYTVANFISDLAPWFVSHANEFQSIEEPVAKVDRSAAPVDLGARFLSLLSILKTVLTHHIFTDSLSPSALQQFVDCAVMMWRLFPVADDATIFQLGKGKGKGDEEAQKTVQGVNMTIIHVKCLLVVAGDDIGSEKDERKLAGFFNDAMRSVWPPQRSLSLQWMTFAHVCLREDVGSRHPKWLKLLVSVVDRILECNTQEGSKVGALCRHISDRYGCMRGMCV